MKHIKTALLMLGAMAWQGALAQDIATEQTQSEPLPSFDMPKEEKEKSAEHTVMANISSGWITSKVFTPRDTYTTWASTMPARHSFTAGTSLSTGLPPWRLA